MGTKHDAGLLGRSSRGLPRIFSTARLVKALQQSMLVAAVVACLLPHTLLAAVTSNVTDGKLTVTSDAGDPITVTCDATQVKVNGGDPSGMVASCANILEMEVTGGPNANTIDLSGVDTVDYTALVTVTVDGAGGSDVITGTFANDSLFGGAESDTIVGHRGNDLMHGDDGDDTLVWNPGDGSDGADGGAGEDTMVVNGGGVSETFTISGTPTGALFQRVTPGPFSVDIISPTENLLLNGNGGGDIVTGTVGLSGVLTMTVNGGDGDDFITGGDGPDTLNGDAGDDLIVGFRGADTMNGGADDDTMVWNPGDGSDIANGEGGNDTMVVNGGGVSETFTISGTATGAFFQRVTPGPFSVDIISPTENLLLNGNGGGDIVTGTVGLSGVLTMTVNGGDGDDFLTGGDGPDTLNGDAGDDLLVGFRGPDTMNGGADNDTMVWNNGDGSDVMDGGAGDDTVVVNGGSLSETFAITPTTLVAAADVQGPLVGSTFFQRVTPGPFTLDIEAESVEVNGNDGDDTFDVTPLDNTDVDFDGGSAPTADILRVNAQGNAAEANSTQVSVAGKQPVTHSDVETVVILNEAFPWKTHLPLIREWEAPTLAQ